MDEWFENVAKIKVRPSSHQTYKGYIDNHIKPSIGNIPLEKLTTMDLQKFYRKLLTKGRVERIESKEQPKGLSAKTVRNINQVISSAMDLAVAQKIILANPTNACELPKVEHQEMQTIPAEQLQAFLEEAMGAIEAPNMVRAISLDVLFNIATILEIEPYILLKFAPDK